MRATNDVRREIEGAQLRILKNLEEGQNLLNRMMGRPPCSRRDAEVMREVYSREQRLLETTGQRLRYVLSEDRCVYRWNYALVLVSNLSGGGKAGREISRLLALLVRARGLYVEGDLPEAAELSARVVARLEP